LGRYYLCPCLRGKFENMFPPPTEKKELTYKEKKALIRKAKEKEKKDEQIRWASVGRLTLAGEGEASLMAIGVSHSQAEE
jgi:hypothetical protein